MNRSLKLLFILVSLIFTSERSSAQMYWNNAGTFAGNSNSYISRGSSTSLNITGSFSLEAWLNPATVTGTRIILQKREGGDPVGYTLQFQYPSDWKNCTADKFLDSCCRNIQFLKRVIFCFYKRSYGYFCFCSRSSSFNKS